MILASLGACTAITLKMVATRRQLPLTGILVELQLNPDVTKRSMGVMEKCTFCIQRINEAKDHAKDEGRLVRDGEVKPACVQSCPTQALAFGNLNDPDSAVSKLAKDSRTYKVLDHHLNTQPAVHYMERLRYKV